MQEKISRDSYTFIYFSRLTLKCLNNFKKYYYIKKHLLQRLEKRAVAKEELEKELCTKVLTNVVLDYLILNYHLLNLQ